MRNSTPALLLLALLLGCAHKRSPAEDALVKRGDCKELLLAADLARAREQLAVAQDLANGCGQDKLTALVDRSPPAEGLLWCGRARAAKAKATCDDKVVAALTAQLRPLLKVGPPDPSAARDPQLERALRELETETNLLFDADSPDVIVGRLTISVEHGTSTTTAVAPDARGKTQRVPATQHRFVARAEAQVELAGQTRVLRANDEVRDTTWDAAPSLAVAAKFEPRVPPEDELRHRAALAWVRALAKALAAAPPETVDLSDPRGCVAYGLALNRAAGNSDAAAGGAGHTARILACEQLLGEPAGAGIPVP